MKEYQKHYKRRQGAVEAVTEGNVRLARGPGLAGAGAGIAILELLLKWNLPEIAHYGLAATAPLGFLIFAWAWIRLPLKAKFSGRALGAGLTTVVLGAVTLYLTLGGGEVPPVPPLN